MRKIKIAQIGTSNFSHGNQIFTSMKKQPDIFEIVGYAMPEGVREEYPYLMQAFEGYQEYSVEEILANPEIEAVTIETEELYLTKYAQMAAEAGKAIHMEKPGGQNLAAFEKLMETVKEKNLLFHTGYIYRYNPEVIRLLERIKQGELGEIVFVEAQMNSNHGPEIREFFHRFEGGIQFFLGCHMIDLVMQILGVPNNVVPFNKPTGKGGITSVDNGFAVLEYDNATAFAKSCSVEVGGFARRQLVVTGTKGAVELRPLEMHNNSTIHCTGVTEFLDAGCAWIHTGDKRDSEEFDRYDGMMAAFAKYVRGEAENPWSYDYELDLYRTILKCTAER